MPTPGTRMFTAAAVQRAMDEHSARWGAPPGYYTVVARVRRMTGGTQVWQVKVRLFGGRTSHVEDVLFGHEHGDPRMPVRFLRLHTGPAAYTTAQADHLTPAPEAAPAPRPPADPAIKRRLQQDTEKGAVMKFTAWTQSEDRVLAEDFANGLSLSSTAHKLGRTYFGVSRRRTVLGIGRRYRNGKA